MVDVNVNPAVRCRAARLVAMDPNPNPIFDNMAKKPWRYLILGDEKNLDIKSLEKIAPIKRVSTDEIFGY